MRGGDPDHNHHPLGRFALTAEGTGGGRKDRRRHGTASPVPRHAPRLRPVLAFAALFQMVNLFREFAEFAIITGGGPGLATSVLNYYVYQTTFVFGSLASAPRSLSCSWA